MYPHRHPVGSMVFVVPRTKLPRGYGLPLTSLFLILTHDISVHRPFDELRPTTTSRRDFSTIVPRSVRFWCPPVRRLPCRACFRDSVLVRTACTRTTPTFYRPTTPLSPSPTPTLPLRPVESCPRAFRVLSSHCVSSSNYNHRHPY